MELKHWDKIEEYLFDKYCVEGSDPELVRLMKEHDNAVCDDMKNRIADMSSYCEEFVSKEAATLYDGLFWAEEVARDVMERMVDINMPLSDEAIHHVAYRYVYDGERVVSLSYLDNLDILIKDEYEKEQVEEER